MSGEHLPHATATFFELAIALSALSLRTFRGIDHITDTTQHETEEVIGKVNGKKSIDGFSVINHRAICRVFAWAALIGSIGGLVLFGAGWWPLCDGSPIFTFSFVFFLLSFFVAGISESQKMRHYSKIEKKAAGTIEQFATGE